MHSDTPKLLVICHFDNWHNFFLKDKAALGERKKIQTKGQVEGEKIDGKVMDPRRFHGIQRRDLARVSTLDFGRFDVED